MGASGLFNIVAHPGMKTGLIMCAAAIGTTLGFAPSRYHDVMNYGLCGAAFGFAMGHIMERVIFLRTATLENAQSYVIDKLPDAADIPAATIQADKLRDIFGKIAKMDVLTSAVAGAMLGYSVYKNGYSPDLLALAPFMGNLTARFVAATERFDNLLTGRYALVRRSSLPVSGRNPAP